MKLWLIEVQKFVFIFRYAKIPYSVSLYKHRSYLSEEANLILPLSEVLRRKIPEKVHYFTYCFFLILKNNKPKTKYINFKI